MPQISPALALIISICPVGKAVADLGFSEGGFYYSIARKARAKFLQSHPLGVKPRPFSIVLERLLSVPVNRSVFDQDLC